MQLAATQLPDTSTERMRGAHTLSANGERRRAWAVESPAVEDSCERELDLVRAAEWAAEEDTEQLHTAWDLVNERELKIASLNARMDSLEKLANELTEALRAREAELAELRERPLSSPVSLTGDVAESRVCAPAGPPTALAGKPEREAWAPERSLLLKRVSLGGWSDAYGDLELEFGEDSQFFSGITRDATRGGFFVATYCTLDPGTFVELEFATSTGETLLMNGVVAWLREAGSPQAERPGLGIAFSGLPSAARTIVEECWRARPPLYVEL